MDVEYTRTNESITDLYEAMQGAPDGPVLSIAGSGMQPLAFLAFGQPVVAVDTDNRQVALTGERARLLRDGLDDRFFLGMTPSQEEFFRGKIEEIRRNLPLLSVTQEDIFSPYAAFSKASFSRIYLSNAHTYNILLSAREAREQVNTLCGLARRMPKGGLLYLAQRPIDMAPRIEELLAALEMESVMKDHERSRIASRPPTEENGIFWSASVVYRKL